MTPVNVLVSVQTNDGVAGVLRDEDGAMWLSWRIDGLGGPRLDDYRPDHLGLPDDRTLIGGRLPPGAVGAEAVDDAGRRVTAVAGRGADHLDLLGHGEHAAEAGAGRASIAR